MKCPNCQEALAEDAQFCGTCGMSTAAARSDASTQIYLHQSTNSDSRKPDTDEPHSTKQDSRIGLVLDSKYKLVEHLGEGGMGSVFRAQRLHICDEVAVKLLHPDLVREELAIQRFRREARSAAMIRHQNVVSIHDFHAGRGAADASGASGGNAEAYIVMELVRGVSLGNLLRREGRISARRAVGLMRDICAGVGVAHRQGLLHRDLKPDNVIVTPPSDDGEDETAKVVDFGLAKVRDVTTSTALTHAGAVIGTLYYMSPEQCSGEELDARADVYSLGAMFYEMLTGDPPFHSNNLAGLIAKHLNAAPPPFPESLQIPPALAQVCFRALAKDPRQRQSDAVVLGRELQAALTAPDEYLPSSSPSQPRGAVPMVQTIPQQRQDAAPVKWALVGGAGLFVVVLLIGTGIAIKYGADRLTLTRQGVENNSVNQNTPNRSTNGTSTTSESAQSETENKTSNSSTEDLRGTWTGTYGPFGHTTKLIIKNHKGVELDGVLEQGDIRVAFNGTYNSVSRTISLKQTAVLDGQGWSLGEDAGKLSADGKKMTGTGKDVIGGVLGMSYEWSFKRQ